jgi:hypothetical protein
MDADELLGKPPAQLLSIEKGVVTERVVAAATNLRRLERGGGGSPTPQPDKGPAAGKTAAPT